MADALLGSTSPRLWIFSAQMSGGCPKLFPCFQNRAYTHYLEGCYMTLNPICLENLKPTIPRTLVLPPQLHFHLSLAWDF